MPEVTHEQLAKALRGRVVHVGEEGASAQGRITWPDNLANTLLKVIAGELPGAPEEGGCHHYRDPATCENCKEEACEARMILSEVRAVDKAVAEAELAIRSALKSLGRLMGELYYIELAEGAEGKDAERELDEALLRLRHVTRIIEKPKRWLEEAS